MTCRSVSLDADTVIGHRDFDRIIDPANFEVNAIGIGMFAYVVERLPDNSDHRPLDFRRQSDTADLFEINLEIRSARLHLRQKLAQRTGDARCRWLRRAKPPDRFSHPQHCPVDEIACLPRICRNRLICAELIDQPVEREPGQCQILGRSIM